MYIDHIVPSALDFVNGSKKENLEAYQCQELFQNMLKYIRSHVMILFG